MGNDAKPPRPSAGFSFAVRELRQHHAAQAAASARPGASTTAAPAAAASTAFPPRRARVKLSLDDSTPEKAGFDPYNTSGSFDRSKNWSRVYKR